MRVLLAVPPSETRLHQVVPLGWALRAAGHEVQVAGPPAFATAINQTGLVAVAGDLMSYAQLWRPAVVIWDDLVPDGAVCAGAVDALGVRMLGMFDPAGGTAPGDLTVDFLPPSLRADGERRSVRFVPYTGPFVIPSWLRRRPLRPRVLLTVASADVGAVFDAVDGVDAEVICAADGVPPDANLPDNVRLLAELPLVAALPTCSAVVHDGAVSAALAALSEGLPQLVVGAGPGLSRRIAEQGAGLLAGPGDPLAEQVGRLLADPSLRAHAERLRAEVAALPSPRDLVAELATLAAGICGAAVS
jgi:UDP:flavonoid glycosyltransferase YjiC (YdhE family)